MTKLTVFLFILFFLFVLPSRIAAHPGRTAADGCHYCRTNCASWGVPANERHCHGGSAPVQPVQEQAPTQQENIVAVPEVQTYTPVPVKTIYRTPTPTLTPTPTIYIETDLDRKQMFKVISIIDGDTIDVMIRGRVERIRLLAIDTPKTKDPRKPVQCFGAEATVKLKSLIDSKFVKLVDDRTQGNRDKYKRLLRYVYDGTLFVNAEMVKQGYAFSYKEYPTKYLEQFNALEKQARDKNLGLWGSCN
jgi:micrococcal nuclease